MDPKSIDSVCKQIYRRFPDLAGSKPKVTAQKLAGESAPSSNYLFVFKGQGTTQTGQAISRIVRAVVSKEGKIIKVTTSR